MTPETVETADLVAALNGLLGAMSSSVARLSKGVGPNATFADVLTADELAQMDRAAALIAKAKAA